MNKRGYLVIYCLILSLSLIATVLWVPLTGPMQADAQSAGLTPVTGHSEVRTAFPFLFKLSPTQSGWSTAEFKNEREGQYYKVDALPGCATWQSVDGDTRPGLVLHAGVSDCAGFTIAFGYIYWFSSPPGQPTATPTAAALPSPFPSPSATGPVSPTPTPAPIGTPVVITVTPPTPVGGGPVCNPQISIYGVDERVSWGNVPSLNYQANNGECGTLVVLLDKPYVVTMTHRILESDLVDTYIRNAIMRCLEDLTACEAINTPTP